MKRIFSILAILLTFQAYSCTFTVNLFDTFGDGWNGNSITIYVNGTPVLVDITVGTGSTATFTFDALDGDFVSITYDNSGSWTNENEYTITNPNGAEVFEDGQGGVEPAGGSFTADCTAMPPPPPANDMPCDAISLDPVTSSCNYQQFTTDPALNLSGLPNPSCGTFAGGDVWFTATVPASGRLTVDLQAAGMTEGELAIYTGPDCNTLTELRCQESTWAVPMPSINVITGDGLAGQVVWIRVWEPNNDNQGTFDICAYETPPPPVNNEPCGGLPLSVGTTCTFETHTTESATGSTIPDPTCSWAYAGGDVWFTAVVPASGRLGIQLGAQMMTDAGVAIYSGPDCNTLTEIRCDESTWGMPTPQYVYELDGLAGQTVWIRVWEPDGDNQGTFDICAWEPDPMLEVSTTAYTPEELVQDVLITGCLEAYNVVYTGDPLAIGAFSNGLTGVGFNSGVIMSSGYVESASGPGTDFASDMHTPGTGDADLDAILTGFTTNDAAVLEFDFVPSSDFIEFRYVFGSEEYPEFVNSSFNDAFAFFISGGPEGYVNQNIALVPGTTIPVTIDNVNDVTNSTYYINNEFATTDVIYDGLTVVLTAQVDVTACEEYHIKLAIADAGDSSYDSGVFLEAGSFSSGGDVLMNHYSFVGNNNDIYEGCENYYVFERADTSDMTDTVEVLLQIDGTAENGVDISTFPDHFYILPGEIYDTIYYSAIIDNLPEGTEYIVFALENGCPCSVTTTNDTIWIFDNFELQPTITNDQLLCWGETTSLETTINPAMDPALVTWEWSTGETTQNIDIAPTATTTYYVTLSDPCDQDTVLSVEVIVIEDISATFTIADSVCAGETTTLTFTGFSGSSATYTWDFDGATIVSGTGSGPYDLMWTTPGDMDISLLIDDNGCNDASNTTTVVSQVPTTDFTVSEILCAGGILDLTFTGVGNTTSTYDWDFDGATIMSGSGQGPYQITWLTPGNYTVSLNSVFEDGCSSMTPTSYDIYVPQSLTIDYTTVDVTCNGLCNGQVTITNTGGVEPYQYSWSDGFGTTAVGQINTLCAGTTYSVTVSDVNGCAIDTTFSVNEPPQLAYTSSTIDPLCYGGSDGEGTVTASGGTTPYSYQWSDPSNSTTSTVTSLSSGNYTVSITDDNGCILTVPVVINDPAEMYIDVTPDKWICIGQTTLLTAAATGGTPFYTYTWRDLTSGSVYTGASVSVAPVETTFYEVWAEDLNGCLSQTETVKVTVHPPIEMEVLPETDSVCKGQAVNIFATISGGNGGPYLVTDQNGNIVAPPYQVWPTDNTLYILTANDMCGSPSDSDSVDVTVMPDPPNSFMAESTSACQPFTVQFLEINEDDGRTYEWDFGDYNSYNTSPLQNPIHTFEDAGVYDITLEVTSEFGCVSTVTLEDYITVHPNPIAEFIADPPVANILNPIIYFNNISQGATYAYWDFDDGDSSDYFSLDHRFPAVDEYTVELVVVTEYGCSDTTEYTVIIEDEFTFWSPTAFRPDNNGINDHFYIMGEGIVEDGFRMFVYDRFGEKVYETDEYNPDSPESYGWDGRIKGNKLAKTGIYSWVVFYKDKHGNTHEEAGYVTLIR